jgi:hypothetical protein
MYALYSRLYLIKLKSSNNWNNLSVNNIHFNSNTPSVWPCHIVLSAIQPHLNLYWARKRKAYSIDHGFIFKVNKKTYYVKSKKKKNIYQQSLSHKFWNWTHVWQSEVLRYVRVVPQNDNSMIHSNVNIECVKRGLHTRVVELIRLFTVIWGMLFHSWSNACLSSGTEDGGLSRRLTLLSNSSQRCSIGIRSGENAGHGKTSMLCAWR